MFKLKYIMQLLKTFTNTAGRKSANYVAVTMSN